MSTKVNKKSVFHLSSDVRRRLLALSWRLVSLLDKDANEGFSESDLSYRLGPWLHQALMLVWCRPVKAVRKKFSYLGGVDCPRVFVSLDWYNSSMRRINELDAENLRLRKILREHGLLNDDLPF